MDTRTLTSDLGLDICTSAPQPVEVVYVRDILPSDVALLATERGVKAPSLTRIRDSHHALARCLAMGMKPAEAAAITGYSSSRISILQNDPSFQELLEHYRSEVQSAFANFGDRATSLALDLISDVRERHENSPETFNLNHLHDYIKLLADRTGFGPQTKSMNVNVHVNMAEKLEAARKRRDGGGSTPARALSPPREAVGEVELLPPTRLEAAE